MSLPPPRLLVVDNAIDHGMYRPVEHWAALAGFVPEHVHVPGGEPLPEPGMHSHVILSGSESSITEPEGWALRELGWVRQLAERGVHILGSCWGHQLIAAALGGPTCVRRSPTPEFGWEQVEVRDDAGLLAGSFESFVSHFDEVVAGSHPSLRVLARTARCAVHALRWAAAPIWGLQAHPEITAETALPFLRTAAERWPQAAALFTEALQQPVRDSRSGPGLVARFLAS